MYHASSGTDLLLSQLRRICVLHSLHGKGWLSPASASGEPTVPGVPVSQPQHGSDTAGRAQSERWHVGVSESKVPRLFDFRSRMIDGVTQTTRVMMF